jgi:homocysteine S-methyltransferase
MPLHGHALPQLSGSLYLMDAGLETDLIFNRGITISEFAAHTLLTSDEGRAALTQYFEPFLALARDMNTGFILHSATWKAHRHWASAMSATIVELREANRESLRFIADLRNKFASRSNPIVLNAIIGPRGDAYRSNITILAAEAEDYFSEQIDWLTETEADMVSGMTFSQASEGIGFVRAIRGAAMPAAVSFTVETDGRLPNGQKLGDAVREVEAATDGYCAYFMINCAHPDHFGSALLNDEGWEHRVRGIRANASRRSHAELDRAKELDIGNPAELARQYRNLRARLPNLTILGGCCGTDYRHIEQICSACLRA